MRGGKPGTWRCGVLVFPLPTLRVGSVGGTASLAGGDMAVAFARAHPRHRVRVE